MKPPDLARVLIFSFRGKTSARRKDITRGSKHLQSPPARPPFTNKHLGLAGEAAARLSPCSVGAVARRHPLAGQRGCQPGTPGSAPCQGQAPACAETGSAVGCSGTGCLWSPRRGCFAAAPGGAKGLQHRYPNPSCTAASSCGVSFPSKGSSTAGFGCAALQPCPRPAPLPLTPPSTAPDTAAVRVLQPAPAALCADRGEVSRLHWVKQKDNDIRRNNSWS